VELYLYTSLGLHGVKHEIHLKIQKVQILTVLLHVRLSALCTGRPLPRQEDSWYSFLLEAESIPGP
jgi:hypothetical protein